MQYRFKTFLPLRLDDGDVFSPHLHHADPGPFYALDPCLYPGPFCPPYPGPFCHDPGPFCLDPGPFHHDLYVVFLSHHHRVVFFVLYPRRQ